MSLSGNLGFVSLDEVLRLLIRSGQRGSVSVRGDGIDGRVFVTRGGVSLATTTTDEGLETLFRKSQIVEPDAFASGTFDKDDQEVIDLMREITVESIYQLNLHGDTFDVAEGAEARFASPKPFELEQVLEESRRRLEDWAEITQVVSDLDARIRFERDLGEREEVTIKRDAWKVLSEVGAGASVAEIAVELGTTEFWAARIVARLVEDDLLETEEEEPRAAFDPGSRQVAAEEQPGQVEETGFGRGFGGAVDETAETHHPAAGVGPEEPEEPAAFFDHSETPEPEPVWGNAPDVSAVGESAEEDEDFDPNKSWWQEPEDEAGSTEVDETDGDEGDVEEDTEAFLEKVFSELDSSGEEEAEGYGLLRRRRLGAARDIDRDS